MNQTHPLLYHVQNYFQDYLCSERGLSINTVLSYRDTLKLFLNFVAQATGRSPIRLTFSDLNVERVLEFLKSIEFERENSVATRNQRLAALKSFFAYMAWHDLTHAGQYQKITALSMKRKNHRVMEYLTEAEVNSMLKSINRNRRGGERDYILLTFLYNTGARVQEICDLTVGDIRWEPPPSVMITGKGRKTRQVPLWPETAKLLKNYLLTQGVFDDETAKIFVNRQGRGLGRFGVRYIVKTRVRAAEKVCPSLKNKTVGPHTFRHTIAMHLLQSGVDLIVIKSWLGHVNLTTTHSYVEIDLEMKKKALETCRRSIRTKELSSVLNRNKDVIQWLESL